MLEQPTLTVTSAPNWALGVGDIGSGLILLGCFAFVAALVLGLLRRERLSTVGFVLGAASLFGAFACLTVLFVNNQFEYQYVFSHGDALTELKYKIAGVWSGQQGSFLLWACSSAIFGLLALRGTGIYRRWFIAPYSLFLAALCGILAYETPFGLLKDAQHAGKVLMPSTGTGLAPSLENYWVVIHPPTIFMGFGSLTVLFCWAVSAMLTRNLSDWARMVRPWALLSLAILGLGVCMGGFWAYETLGWGGFWAWDPVENTSFVPWLFVAAFIHALIVQTTRDRWHPSTLLLAALPFLSFLYGTFLTRSGFLSEASVHSFAEMNRSALWILLGLLVVSSAGFLVLWITRGVRAIQSNAAQEPGITRESMYKIGVTLLSLFGLAVAIGMSVPFFMSVAGRPSKVVEEGLYHMVVVWFFVPIMLLVALGPFASWRYMGGKVFWNRVINVLALAIGLTGVIVMIFKFPKIGVHVDPRASINLPFSGQALWLQQKAFMPWMVFLTFLCTFALVSNFWRIGELSKRAKIFSLGGFVAHVGLAVLMAGLVISRGFERKELVFAQPGNPVGALGYVLTPGPFQGESMQDRNGKLPVEIRYPSGETKTALLGLYWVRGAQGDMQSMRWPSILHALSHDVYLALGDPVTTVWPEPQMLKPGESAPKSDLFALTYEGLERKGTPGKIGTKFLANLRFTYNGSSYNVKPAMTITDSGPSQELLEAGPSFYVSLVGMDAGTKSAAIQVYYKVPFYPMELYYKPLTSLVWIGTGILTLGGLMAAVYRRARPKREDSYAEPPPSVDWADLKDDAPVSAS